MGIKLIFFFKREKISNKQNRVLFLCYYYFEDLFLFLFSVEQNEIIYCVFEFSFS